MPTDKQIIAVNLSGGSLGTHTAHYRDSYIANLTGRLAVDYNNVNGTYTKLNNDVYEKVGDPSYRIIRSTPLTVIPQSEAGFRHQYGQTSQQKFWYIVKFKQEWDEGGSKFIERLGDLRFSSFDHALYEWGLIRHNNKRWVILFRETVPSETEAFPFPKFENTTRALNIDLSRVTKWVTYDYDTVGAVSTDLTAEPISTFNLLETGNGPSLDFVKDVDQTDIFNPNTPIYESEIRYRVSSEVPTSGNTARYRYTNQGILDLDSYRHDRWNGTPIYFFENFDASLDSGGYIVTYVPPLRFSSEAKPLRADAIMEDISFDGENNLLIRQNISNGSMLYDLDKRIPTWAPFVFEDYETLEGYANVEVPVPFAAPNRLLRDVGQGEGSKHYGLDYSGAPLDLANYLVQRDDDDGKVVFQENYIMRNERSMVFHGSTSRGSHSTLVYANDEEGNPLKSSALKRTGPDGAKSNLSFMEPFEIKIRLDPGGLRNANFARAYYSDKKYDGTLAPADRQFHIAGNTVGGSTAPERQWSGFNPSSALSADSVKRAFIPHWLKVGSDSDRINTNPNKGEAGTDSGGNSSRLQDHDVPFGHYERVDDTGTPEWRYVKHNQPFGKTNWVDSNPAAGTLLNNGKFSRIRDIRIVFVPESSDSPGTIMGFGGPARFELREFNTSGTLTAPNGDTVSGARTNVNPYDVNDPRYNANYVVRAWCKAQRMNDSDPFMPIYLATTPDAGNQGLAQGNPTKFAWNSDLSATTECGIQAPNTEIIIASNHYSVSTTANNKKGTGASFKVTTDNEGKVKEIEYVTGGNNKYWVGERIHVTSGDLIDFNFYIADVTLTSKDFDGWRGYLFHGDLARRQDESDSPTIGKDSPSSSTNSNTAKVYHFGMPGFVTAPLIKGRNNIFHTEHRYNYNHKADNPLQDYDDENAEIYDFIGEDIYDSGAVADEDFVKVQPNEPGDIGCAIYMNNLERGVQGQTVSGVNSSKYHLAMPTLNGFFCAGRKNSTNTSTFQIFLDLVNGWENGTDIFDVDTLTYKYDLDISFSVFPRATTSVISEGGFMFGVPANNYIFKLVCHAYEKDTDTLVDTIQDEIVMFDDDSNIAVPDILIEPNTLCFAGGIVPAPGNNLGGHVEAKFKKIEIKKDNKILHEYDCVAEDAGSLRSISASRLTINESEGNNKVTFTFASTSRRDSKGDRYAYTIRSLSGNVTPDDFLGQVEFDGEFILDDFKKDTLTLTVKADNTLEGDEQLIISLVRFNVSQIITIEDTSFPNTYKLTGNPPATELTRDQKNSISQLRFADFYNKESLVKNIAGQNPIITSDLTAPSPLRFNMFKGENFAVGENVNGVYNYIDNQTMEHESGTYQLLRDVDWRDDYYSVYAIDLVNWGTPAIGINLEGESLESKPNFRIVDSLIGMCPSGFHLPGFINKNKPMGFDPTDPKYVNADQYMFSHLSLPPDESEIDNYPGSAPWNYAHWDEVPTNGEILANLKPLPILSGRRRFERISDTVYRALPTTTEYQYRYLADTNAIYEALHKLPQLFAGTGVSEKQPIIHNFTNREEIISSIGSAESIRKIFGRDIFPSDVRRRQAEIASIRESIGSITPISDLSTGESYYSKYNNASFILPHGYNSGDALLDLHNNILGNNFVQYLQDFIWQIELEENPALGDTGPRWVINVYQFEDDTTLQRVRGLEYNLNQDEANIGTSTYNDISKNGEPADTYYKPTIPEDPDQRSNYLLTSLSVSKNSMNSRRSLHDALYGFRQKYRMYQDENTESRDPIIPTSAKWKPVYEAKSNPFYRDQFSDNIITEDTLHTIGTTEEVRIDLSKINEWNDYPVAITKEVDSTEYIKHYGWGLYRKDTYPLIVEQFQCAKPDFIRVQENTIITSPFWKFDFDAAASSEYRFLFGPQTNYDTISGEGLEAVSNYAGDEITNRKTPYLRELEAADENYIKGMSLSELLKNPSLGQFVKANHHFYGSGVSITHTDSEKVKHYYNETFPVMKLFQNNEDDPNKIVPATTSALFPTRTYINGNYTTNRSIILRRQAGQTDLQFAISNKILDQENTTGKVFNVLDQQRFNTAYMNGRIYNPKLGSSRVISRWLRNSLLDEISQANVNNVIEDISIAGERFGRDTESVVIPNLSARAQLLYNLYENPFKFIPNVEDSPNLGPDSPSDRIFQSPGLGPDSPSIFDNSPRNNVEITLETTGLYQGDKVPFTIKAFATESDALFDTRMSNDDFKTPGTLFTGISKVLLTGFASNESPDYLTDPNSPLKDGQLSRDYSPPPPELTDDIDFSAIRFRDINGLYTLIDQSPYKYVPDSPSMFWSDDVAGKLSRVASNTFTINWSDSKVRWEIPVDQKIIKHAAKTFGDDPYRALNTFEIKPANPQANKPAEAIITTGESINSFPAYNKLNTSIPYSNDEFFSLNINSGDVIHINNGSFDTAAAGTLDTNYAITDPERGVKIDKSVNHTIPGVTKKLSFNGNFTLNPENTIKDAANMVINCTHTEEDKVTYTYDVDKYRPEIWRSHVTKELKATVAKSIKYTFTLSGPAPDYLKRLKAGDRVNFYYAPAVAIYGRQLEHVPLTKNTSRVSPFWNYAHPDWELGHKIYGESSVQVRGITDLLKFGPTFIIAGILSLFNSSSESSSLVNYVHAGFFSFLFGVIFSPLNLLGSLVGGVQKLILDTVQTVPEAPPGASLDAAGQFNSGSYPNPYTLESVDWGANKFSIKIPIITIEPNGSKHSRNKFKAVTIPGKPIPPEHVGMFVAATDAPNPFQEIVDPDNPSKRTFFIEDPRKIEKRPPDPKDPTTWPTPTFPAAFTKDIGAVTLPSSAVKLERFTESTFYEDSDPNDGFDDPKDQRIQYAWRISSIDFNQASINQSLNSFTYVPEIVVHFDNNITIVEDAEIFGEIDANDKKLYGTIIQNPGIFRNAGTSTPDAAGPTYLGSDEPVISKVEVRGGGALLDLNTGGTLSTDIPVSSGVPSINSNYSFYLPGESKDSIWQHGTKSLISAQRFRSIHNRPPDGTTTSSETGNIFRSSNDSPKKTKDGIHYEIAQNIDNATWEDTFNLTNSPNGDSPPEGFYEIPNIDPGQAQSLIFEEDGGQLKGFFTIDAVNDSQTVEESRLLKGRAKISLTLNDDGNIIEGDEVFHLELDNGEAEPLRYKIVNNLQGFTLPTEATRSVVLDTVNTYEQFNDLIKWTPAEAEPNVTFTPQYGFLVRNGSGNTAYDITTTFDEDKDDDRIFAQIESNRRNKTSRLRLRGMYTIKTFPEVKFEYQIREAAAESRNKFSRRLIFNEGDKAAFKVIPTPQSPESDSPGFNSPDIVNVDRTYNSPAGTEFVVFDSPGQKYNIDDLVVNVERIGWPPDTEVDSPQLTRAIHTVEPDQRPLRHIPYWVMWQVLKVDTSSGIPIRSTTIELVEYLKPVRNTTGEHLGDLVAPFTKTPPPPADFSPSGSTYDSPGTYINPFNLNGPYRRVAGDRYRKYDNDNNYTKFAIEQEGVEGIQGTASGKAKWLILDAKNNIIFHESVNTYPWIDNTQTTNLTNTVPTLRSDWDPILKKGAIIEPTGENQDGALDITLEGFDK